MSLEEADTGRQLIESAKVREEDDTIIIIIQHVDSVLGLSLM